MDVQIFVSNWHRVDAQHYSCDRSKNTCVPDTNGTFTDEALCNANCGTSKTAYAPTGVELVLVVKHTATATANTATIRRIDDQHANPQALWKAWGSPQYVTPTQIAALNKASKTTAEQVQVEAVSATESKITVDLPEITAVHITL